MKVAHKLSIGFLAFALLIWISGLIMISISKSTLRDMYTVNVTSFSRKIMDDVEKEISSKIDIFRAYSRDTILRDTIRKSNKAFGDSGDVSSVLIEGERLWKSSNDSGGTRFRAGILNNVLSVELNERIEYYAEQYGYPLFESVTVTNKYGAVVARTQAAPGYRLDKSDWWNVLQNKDIYIAKHDASGNGERSVFNIGIRVDDGRENFVGAIMVVMSMQEVIKIVKSMQAAYKEKLFDGGTHNDANGRYKDMATELITKTGQLLYSSADEDGEQPDNLIRDYRELILTGPSGVLDMGEDLYIHIHSKDDGGLLEPGWILITHHDKKSIFAPVSRLRNRLMGISLGITLFAVFMGALMAARITRPIEKLRKAAERIGAGDLDTGIELKSNDEIGRLADTLQKMTKNLKTTISARDTLMNRLMDSREEIRSVVDNANDAIISIDSRGRVIFWNSAAAEIFGYSANESFKKSIEFIVPGELNQRPDNMLKLLVHSSGANAPGSATEFTGLKKNGAAFPIEISLARMTLKGKKYFTAIIRDITERKKAEDAIREREEIYSTLFEATSDAIFIIKVDPEGNAKFIDCNETAQSILKCTRDEIIGRGPANFSSPMQQDGRTSAVRLEEVLADTINGAPQFFEWACVRSDGSRFPTEVTMHSMEIRGEKYIQAIIRDISAREHSDNVIKLQLSRLNVLYSVEKAITSSPDLSETLNHLLDQVITHLRIDAASLLLMDKHTQTLQYEIGKGFRLGTKYTKFIAGEGTAKRAADERRTIIVRDPANEPAESARSKYLSEEKFVTYFAVPLISRDQVKGVLELFHRTPLKEAPDWLEFIDTLAHQAAIAIDNAALFDGLQSMNMELISAYDNTIYGLSRALDMRDKETEGHSRRVTEMTVRIAEHMEIKDSELVHMRRGALLHDIGKMGIPDKILLKPGRLTDTERDTMQLHVVYGYEILQEIEYLRPSLDIPLYHHERWDGTGYPKGLKGKGIPLSARIFAIVDVWDALSSDRPYRSAWPEDKVDEHILSQAGTHFDPEMVKVFFELMKAVRAETRAASNRRTLQSAG